MTQTLREQGNQAYKNGAYKEAVALYTQAIDQCQTSDTDSLVALYSNRAAAYRQLFDYPATITDANQALALHPSSAKALYRKACALHSLGNVTESWATAQTALKIEPQNAQLLELITTLNKKLPAGPTSNNKTPTSPDFPITDSPATSNTSTNTNPNSPISPAGSGNRKPPVTAPVFPPLLRATDWLYEGAPDGVDENLLILFHGLGDSPQRYMQLAKTLALPQTAVLAVGGLQEVPFAEGGRSWFTVFDADLELIKGVSGERRRLESLQSTVQLLQGLIQALHARCRWNSSKIHLLGYSQGGTVALELTRLLTAARTPIGSVIAVSAALLEEQLSPEWLQATAATATASRSTCPALITHGDVDDRVRRSDVEATIKVLQCFGVQTELYNVAGKGHGMVRGTEEAQKLMEFWGKCLGMRPNPGEGVGVGGVQGGLFEVKGGIAKPV